MSDYMKSILNAFHDMLFVFTKEGIIDDYLTTNHKDELIEPKEAFLHKHHREVLPEYVNSQIEQAFNTLDQGKEQYKFDYSLIQNGQRQWYVAILSKITYGDEIKYLGAVRNITARKSAEIELAKKNEELKELNRQKDKLFSVISHDLKNAVAGMVGTYDMILEDYEEFSKEELFEYLTLLDQRSRNTAELLEDLLQWSRNQFKEVTTDPENLNVAQIADTVFNGVISRADQKSITLKNRVSDDLHVYADPNMLKTILRNLIINGIKFSHQDGEITVNAESHEEVKISVTDQGVGMDEETVRKVLNKKTTYTTEGTSGEKGSGLGLDLCIDFVEKHNGEIWADSQPGEGTTFMFTLPSNN